VLYLLPIPWTWSKSILALPWCCCACGFHKRLQFSDLLLWLQLGCSITPTLRFPFFSFASQLANQRVVFDSLFLFLLFFCLVFLVFLPHLTIWMMMGLGPVTAGGRGSVMMHDVVG